MRPADAVRQYLVALFTLPPEVVVRAHIAEEDSRFAISRRGVAPVSQEQGLQGMYRRLYSKQTTAARFSGAWPGSRPLYCCSGRECGPPDWVGEALEVRPPRFIT